MRAATAFAVFITIATGLLMLGSYFFSPLIFIRTLFLNWAIILAGSATLVGFINLILVHTDKVRRNEKGSVYSALLVISLAVTFLAGFVLRPDHIIMKAILDGIIIPAEAALMGILSVSLLYAAIRLLRRRMDLTSIIFLITAALLFLGSVTVPFFGEIPLINTFAHWVTQVGALGGARGILIGVALGTLTTSLRVLFGVDRPYGGN